MKIKTNRFLPIVLLLGGVFFFLDCESETTKALRALGQREQCEGTCKVDHARHPERILPCIQKKCIPPTPSEAPNEMNLQIVVKTGSTSDEKK